MGGDFILNKEGTIAWIYLGRTGDDRPSVNRIEQVLQVNTVIVNPSLILYPCTPIHSPPEMLISPNLLEVKP